MPIGKKTLPDCPVAATVSIIGSKWKLMILRNLRMKPTWRFNELKNSLEGISQKVLTESLRGLEEDGIISRTVYPEVPPRVEYKMTWLGEQMAPIFEAMNQWGQLYQQYVNSDGERIIMTDFAQAPATAEPELLAPAKKEA